jgi:hypothetical protein
MTTPSRPSLDELAAGEIDATDLRALNRLANMYSVLDPVPAGLVERAQFGITLDALHARTPSPAPAPMRWPRRRASPSPVRSAR